MTPNLPDTNVSMAPAGTTALSQPLMYGSVVVVEPVALTGPVALVFVPAMYAGRSHVIDLDLSQVQSNGFTFTLINGTANWNVTNLHAVKSLLRVKLNANSIAVG
jgi:hypothetical protein